MKKKHEILTWYDFLTTYKIPVLYTAQRWVETEINDRYVTAKCGYVQRKKGGEKLSKV